MIICPSIMYQRAAPEGPHLTCAIHDNTSGWGMAEPRGTRRANNTSNPPPLPGYRRHSRGGEGEGFPLHNCHGRPQATVQLPTRRPALPCTEYYSVSVLLVHVLVLLPPPMLQLQARRTVPRQGTRFGGWAREGRVKCARNSYIRIILSRTILCQLGLCAAVYVGFYPGSC